MKFMGMITIGWSLKQRHQRQASIMSLYFNLPFAAIALIFLMGCSLGSGWQQNKRNENHSYEDEYIKKRTFADGFPARNTFDMHTQVMPNNESFNYTSSTEDNNVVVTGMKDSYYYGEEKLIAMNITQSLTTKLFPSYGFVDPIKNIGRRATLHNKKFRGNDGHYSGSSSIVKSSSPILHTSPSPTSFSFLDTSQNLSKRLHNKETQTSSQNRNDWYPKHSVRFVRSARKHLRLRSDIPTTSLTKLGRSTSPNVDGTKRERFHRKRMTANHNIGFKMPPHIDKSRSTGNVSVMVGKQLLLTCTIPNTGNESISWIRHKDSALLAVNNYIYSSSHRIKVFHENRSSEWKLSINPVEVSDDGIYECQIATTPTTFHSMAVSVIVPHTTILGNSDLFIEAGSTINLTCIIQAESMRDTHIYWNYEGKIIAYDRKRGGTIVIDKRPGGRTVTSLIISQADITDSGNYTCDPASNYSKWVIVHVTTGSDNLAMRPGPVVGSASSFRPHFYSDWLRYFSIRYFVAVFITIVVKIKVLAFVVV